jgi:putative effector of murein hydrolase
MLEIIEKQWQQTSQSSWVILLSLIGFWVGISVYRRSHKKVLFHPLLVSTPLIAGAILWLQIDYTDYYKGNGLLNWLLGPATVALAVPLARYLRQLSSLLPVILTAVFAGGLFAALCAILLGFWLVTDTQLVLSLAAKSVTTPIAMIITEQLGGMIILVTIIVLMTGIVGIFFADKIFNRLALTDERWQGLVLGITAHAIGTLIAFEKSPRCGAFSTIGMGLNGIWTSFFLIPLVNRLIH